MQVFYILDLVVNALILCGFAFRYNQTKVRYYLWLAGAVLATLVADVLLAFLATSLPIIVIYTALILVLIAGLGFILTEVFMLQDWVMSMRRAPQPAANKLQRAQQIIKILKITYPVLTLLMVALYVVMLVSLMTSGIIALVVALVYTAAVVTQVAVMIWMWLDFSSTTKKRNQLAILTALTFLSAWPALLGGLGAGVGVSVCWWLWFAIALWPNSLVGFEEEPEEAMANK